MDVDRGIRVAVDTGDVTLGSEKSIQSLKLGKSLVYDGTSVDLGSVCGKPFTVATLIVNDPGDSTILDDLR